MLAKKRRNPGHNPRRGEKVKFDVSVYAVAVSVLPCANACALSASSTWLHCMSIFFCCVNHCSQMQRTAPSGSEVCAHSSERNVPSTMRTAGADLAGMPLGTTLVGGQSAQTVVCATRTNVLQNGIWAFNPADGTLLGHGHSAHVLPSTQVGT